MSPSQDRWEGSSVRRADTPPPRCRAAGGTLQAVSLPADKGGDFPAPCPARAARSWLAAIRFGGMATHATDRLTRTAPQPGLGSQGSHPCMPGVHPVAASRGLTRSRAGSATWRRGTRWRRSRGGLQMRRATTRRGGWSRDAGGRMDRLWTPPTGTYRAGRIAVRFPRSSTRWRPGRSVAGFTPTLLSTSAANR